MAKDCTERKLEEGGMRIRNNKKINRFILYISKADLQKDNQQDGFIFYNNIHFYRYDDIHRRLFCHA